MKPKPSPSAQFSAEFFRGAVVAIASGVTKKTVHADALKEGWPWRKRFNFYEYRVPLWMESRCKEGAQQIARPEPKPPSVQLADLLVNVGLRQRTFVRELVVRRFLGYQRENPAQAQFSLRDVTIFVFKDVFRYALPKFNVSTRSLARCVAAYQRFVLPGLCDLNAG